MPCTGQNPKMMTVVTMSHVERGFHPMQTKKTLQETQTHLFESRVVKVIQDLEIAMRGVEWTHNPEFHAT